MPLPPHTRRMGDGHASLARHPRDDDHCAEGKTKTEIIRCLKRYVAREVYPHLRPAAG